MTEKISAKESGKIYEHAHEGIFKDRLLDLKMH